MYCCLLYIIERQKKLFNLNHFKLKGNHNAQNLLLAVAAARKIGLSPEGIKDSLSSYKQLPHRLETIHQNNKLEIINKKRGNKSSGENKIPLLKLSFFSENPFLFSKYI